MSFYAARQPILNKDKTLFAYELLFRQSFENIFPNIDGDEATAKLIEGVQFNLGLDSLVQDSLAFINFTHNSLIEGYPLLLPKEKIVVEILESVRPGKKLLNTCIELTKNGYIIALDDYEHNAVWKHFFPYVSIIKLDYSLTSEKQFQKIKQAIIPFPNIKLLAEKIETHDQYQHALDIGCEYFQGYFFSKPEVIKSVAFNPSQISVINLMAEMNKVKPNVQNVTSIFEGDVNLSFKLLRYTQSPMFKRRVGIETIKQAIVVLGLQELKRFVSLLFTAQFSDGKPKELIVMSLIRARFSELVASFTMKSSDQSSVFLIGLLSLMDAMVDADINELMGKLPIPQHMKDAIVSRKGESANFLKLCELFENADWPGIDEHCKKLNITSAQSAELFQNALTWATTRMQAIP